MNWANIKIEQSVTEYSDGLVEFSKDFVDKTGIYKKNGLSISQIHNLTQNAYIRKSIDGLTYFIDEEAERSSEGKGWKYSQNDQGQLFSDSLKESLDELEDRAKAISADVGYEYEKEIAITLVRKFLVYMVWYISSKRKEDREEDKQ
jgi:hypothetical protein